MTGRSPSAERVREKVRQTRDLHKSLSIVGKMYLKYNLYLFRGVYYRYNVLNYFPVQERHPCTERRFGVFRGPASSRSLRGPSRDRRPWHPRSEDLPRPSPVFHDKSTFVVVGLWYPRCRTRSTRQEPLRVPKTRCRSTHGPEEGSFRRRPPVRDQTESGDEGPVDVFETPVVYGPRHICWTTD